MTAQQPGFIMLFGQAVNSVLKSKHLQLTE